MDMWVFRWCITVQVAPGGALTTDRCRLHTSILFCCCPLVLPLNC